MNASRSGVVVRVPIKISHSELGRRKEMGRQKEIPPAVRVYTVCDESRYIITTTYTNRFCLFFVFQSLNLFVFCCWIQILGSKKRAGFRLW